MIWCLIGRFFLLKLWNFIFVISLYFLFCVSEKVASLSNDLVCVRRFCWQFHWIELKFCRCRIYRCFEFEKEENPCRKCLSYGVVRDPRWVGTRHFCQEKIIFLFFANISQSCEFLIVIWKPLSEFNMMVLVRNFISRYLWNDETIWNVWLRSSNCDA